MRVIAGPGEEDPGHEREGAADHRLPRDGPRDRRAPTPSTPTRSTRSRSSAAARPSATRSRCRPEDKFLTTTRRAHRHDGDDARRPRRGGDRLRRDHHRRLQRPREGHRDGQADGHALRHVRAARPARLRPRPRPCRSSAASSPPSRTTPTRSRARSTTRSAASSRTPTSAPRTSSPSTASSSTRSREILLERETIEADEFIALLEGKPEDEIFADDEEEEAKPPEAPPVEEKGTTSRGRLSPPGAPASRPGRRRRGDARQPLVAGGQRNKPAMAGHPVGGRFEGIRGSGHFASL